MKLLSRLSRPLLLQATLLASALMPAHAADSYPRVAENRVIYEVFVRNFSPEGNLKGVEAQIPRLKELGVDVVWLMPIYKLGDIGKWGTYSSPYAIKNYKAVDPDNGTEADLRSLVNTIHAAGMEIWFDWVGNHTSKDNVWVADHPEWYQHQGSNPYNRDDIVSPNGWSDVYQLNVNNSAMHDAMIDAMQYWVTEFDIDGYRCDYASGPTTEFWQKCRDRVLKNGKPVAWLAEDDTKPELVKNGIFDYNYAWAFHDRLLDFARGGNVANLRSECAALNENSAYAGRSRMVYLSNHDVVQDKGGTEDRLFGKYLRPLTVLYFTVYGMPLIYAGQEIQYKHDRVSLAEKTPIDWSNPDATMTKMFKTLCALKHSQTALRTGSQNGSLTNLSTSDDNSVYAYRRTSGDNHVVVMLNFADSNKSFSVNGLPSGKYTDAFSGKTVDFDNPGQFSLPAQGYAVYTLADASTPVDPIEPTKQYSVYINNLSPWPSLGLYGYNEDGASVIEPFGSWPGATPDGTVSKDGVEYARFPIPTSYNDMTFHLIANTGVIGEGKPQHDYDGTFTFDKDIYLDLIVDEPDPSAERAIYVTNSSSWSNLHLYGWRDGQTELFDSWPGAEPTSYVTIGGRQFARFVVPAEFHDMTYNLIINNGDKGAGNQLDGPTTVLDGDKYLEVTPSSFHIINVSTSVEIIAGDQPQAVRYYDMRGREIADPRASGLHGLFIRLEGSNATKIVI